MIIKGNEFHSFIYLISRVKGKIRLKFYWTYIVHMVTTLFFSFFFFLTLNKTLALGMLFSEKNLWRFHCSAVKVKMVTTIHVTSQDDMIVIISY